MRVCAIVGDYPGAPRRPSSDEALKTVAAAPSEPDKSDARRAAPRYYCDGAARLRNCAAALLSERRQIIIIIII